jgi:hypothetical protein
MARLDITIKHGQEVEGAQEKFREALLAFQKRHAAQIERLDWAEDGQSATLAGHGFEVRCWYDQHDLHIKGTIPLTWKLLESAFRSEIKREIDRAPAPQRR